MPPHLEIEQKYYPLFVAGIDEAGRGPLAGPVVAAAVMIPIPSSIATLSHFGIRRAHLGELGSARLTAHASSDQLELENGMIPIPSSIATPNIIDGIDDSKKLSPKKRAALYELITKQYVWSVGIVDAQEIDKINILEATKMACIIAANELRAHADIILVDGNMKFTDPKFKSVVNGDNISMSIAAASIIAKVTRDNMMTNFSKQFPHYGWDQNFGYGTKSHIEAIRIFGPSPLHRNSFKVKSLG